VWSGKIPGDIIIPFAAAQQSSGFFLLREATQKNSGASENLAKHLSDPIRKESS
jgi:hypothetical protein